MSLVPWLASKVWSSRFHEFLFMGLFRIVSLKCFLFINILIFLFLILTYQINIKIYKKFILNKKTFLKFKKTRWCILLRELGSYLIIIFFLLSWQRALAMMSWDGIGGCSCRGWGVGPVTGHNCIWAGLLLRVQIAISSINSGIIFYF